MLLVPGGPGVPDAMGDREIVDWITSVASTAELTMSVCTGSALLAGAGVLKGKSATTNKANFNWVAEQGPDIRWTRQARWVEDGGVFTSSGVSAGMDMALAVIAKLHGRDKADAVAWMAEYTWHDDADNDPFSAVHGIS